MTLDFDRTFDPAHGEAVRLLPWLRRITASNGGPFTFHGTNTYLIGETKYQVADIRPSDGADNRSFWAGGTYLNASWRYYTNLCAAVEPINQPTGGDYTGASVRWREDVVGRTFGSFHVGGCNIVFADGSVHFMPNATDIMPYPGTGSVLW